MKAATQQQTTLPFNEEENWQEDYGEEEPLTFTFADLKEAAEELAREEEEEGLEAVTSSRSHKRKEEEPPVEAYDPQADEAADVEEHKDLYGESEWRMVMAAETVTQSNFIKFCDANSPALWP